MSSSSSKRAGAKYSTSFARMTNSPPIRVGGTPRERRDWGRRVAHAERAEVRGAREVEVRVVAAVVDDALRVGVREADPGARRERILVHERITVRTSSRFSSIEAS